MVNAIVNPQHLYDQFLFLPLKLLLGEALAVQILGSLTLLRHVPLGKNFLEKGSCFRGALDDNLLSYLDQRGSIVDLANLYFEVPVRQAKLVFDSSLEIRVIKQISSDVLSKTPNQGFVLFFCLPQCICIRVRDLHGRRIGITSFAWLGFPAGWLVIGRLECGTLPFRHLPTLSPILSKRAESLGDHSRHTFQVGPVNKQALSLIAQFRMERFQGRSKHVRLVTNLQQQVQHHSPLRGDRVLRVRLEQSPGS